MILEWSATRVGGTIEGHERLPSLLSLEAVHRRSWGSLYAALAEGCVNSTALRGRLCQFPLVDGQLIYAVGRSV